MDVTKQLPTPSTLRLQRGDTWSHADSHLQDQQDGNDDDPNEHSLTWGSMDAAMVAAFAKASQEVLSEDTASRATGQQ